jgi:hypothetical protein
MISKSLCQKKIKEFKIKHSLEASDENVISTIHLMNENGLEHNAAKDQSSRSGNDNGIDAWYFNDKTSELFIYQSKLSESKSLVLNGLNDLYRASEWLEKIIIEGSLDRLPVDNHMLYGLYTKLSQIKDSIKKIIFVLISVFDENEIEDDSAVENFNEKMSKSRLNEYVYEVLEGKIQFKIQQYSLDTTIPNKVKQYEIHTLQDSRIALRSESFLQLSYVSLISLIELYRQRGDVLFDKNVRLSLLGTKEIKGRLLHPLFDTLDGICNGTLSPSIFPFYHIGVTISATRGVEGKNFLFTLESPSVINGCQTITLAHEYLKKLESEKNEIEKNNRIEKFKEILVIVKVVVGVSEEELKEITNANNRQNPIENWQLFSNDSIHVAIENALKEKGVFYERQKGKFETVMKNTDNAKNYPNTNGTYIKVEQLGQIVALARKELQYAAKLSLIFEHKKNHDFFFEPRIDRFPTDMIFCLNTLKVLTRGLSNYLQLPTHAENNYTRAIFVKPIVKSNVFYLGLIYYYQSSSNSSLRIDYSKHLLKIANPNFASDTEKFFYPKIVAKIRNWYIEESKNLEIDVSNKKMDIFFKDLFLELKLDNGGNLPFTETSLQFSEHFM